MKDNILMIGEKIHNYIVTRLIGEGGMASVYEAVHEKLKTKVAVKVLNPMLAANSSIRQRFENEARFMAGLTHPNITRVIDYEERPDLLAIILEFLEGEDLNVLIKQKGPMAIPDVITYFTQVLDAFDYAHKKGIVHRDVKPSNIFIEPSGTIKILDFGIAKLLGATEDMTMTGTQMGTPVYMSPEQVNTDKTIDHRSDIYSLGVTLYYMLKGEPPYDTTTSSSFQIYTKIVHEPLPDLTKYPEIDKILKIATHKDRSLRFQSCKEFRQALIEATETKKPAAPLPDSEKTLIDIPEPARKEPVPVVEPKEKKKAAEKKEKEAKAPAKPLKTKTLVFSALGAVGLILIALFVINPSWLSQIFTSKEEKQAEAKLLLEMSKSTFKNELVPYIYEGAVTDLKRASKLDPENQEIQYFLGHALYRLNLKDSFDITVLSYKTIAQASDAFEKTIQINPEYTGENATQDPYSMLTTIWGDLALKYLVSNQNDSALMALREGRKRGGFNDVTLEVAANILNSCDENAILFLQYDIPFSPVIYMQLVENLRTDVKAIKKTSLENTWYFNYLRENMAVPFSFGETWYGLMADKPWETQVVTVENVKGQPLSWWVYGNSSGMLSKLDQVILDIITTNKFASPVHYSVFFDFSTGLLNLGQFMYPDGLVYKVNPGTQTDYYRSQQLKLQSLNYAAVKDSHIPSTDLRGILDIIRNLYLQESKAFYDQGDRVSAQIVKSSMESNIPLANYPFQFKEVESAYTALVNKLDFTDDQMIQKEKSDIREYLARNKLVGSPTASGLYYIETKAGTGNLVKPGRTVKVHYTGTFLDGTKFDSSYDRSEPYEFKLGAGQVIKGWDEGIAMMRLGSKGLLIIPFDLGYGRTDMTSIPAYSTLVFEVELVDIN